MSWHIACGLTSLRWKMKQLIHVSNFFSAQGVSSADGNAWRWEMFSPEQSLTVDLYISTTALLPCLGSRSSLPVCIREQYGFAIVNKEPCVTLVIIGI